MFSEGKILSIQSHVVSGYAGNKSVVFPLQILGFEVDAINSVQFSNHTEYQFVKGQVLNDNDLRDLLEALKHNGLDRNYTHLLTGFCASPTFLTGIAQAVQDLRITNHDLVYVCDPVMGDNGKMYVPQDLLPIYKEKILPLADIITPNQYEVELLTGKTLSSLEDAWIAIDSFHALGCKTVAISSTQLGSDGYLLCVASQNNGSKKTKTSIKIPVLNESFTGTGDLFTALFLAWMTKSKNDLVVSLENTVASLQAVLYRTIDATKEKSQNGMKTTEELELKLIQSKADIEHPQVLLHAQIHSSDS